MSSRTQRAAAIASTWAIDTAAVTDAFGSPSLVFTSAEGQQIRANNLRRRAWADAVAACDLRGFTFHDMRHTAVSLWVAADASDLEVAKWAGHRSAAFTKSRYVPLPMGRMRAGVYWFSRPGAKAAGLWKRPDARGLGNLLIVVGSLFGGWWFWTGICPAMALIVIVGVIATEVRSPASAATTP